MSSMEAGWLTARLLIKRGKQTERNRSCALADRNAEPPLRALVFSSADRSYMEIRVSNDTMASKCKKPETLGLLGICVKIIDICVTFVHPLLGWFWKVQPNLPIYLECCH